MRTDITIPTDLWEEDEDCAITAWLASDGGQVTEGALIVEIMTVKVQHEVHVPSTGTLTIVKQQDDVAAKGEVIGYVSS